jgi:acyl carrier protein
MWDIQFEQQLRRFLPYLAADEPLEADTELRDFGLDSMATVELLAELESAYQVRFADDALSLETFQTPTVLWQALDATRAAAA